MTIKDYVKKYVKDADKYRNYNRDKKSVIKHIIVGSLGEFFYNFYINKDAIRVENFSYDFIYYVNDNIKKVEVKTIYNNTKSKYVKIARANQQQINAEFDEIVLIERLKSINSIYDDFKKNLITEKTLIDYFRCFTILSKEYYIKYRFKSKFDDFFYIDKKYL